MNADRPRPPASPLPLAKALVTTCLAAAMAVAGCGGGGDDGADTAAPPTTMAPNPDANTDPAAIATATTLSADEAASLRFVREEEKLARDVYLQLAVLWSQRTFDNIARSEQSHMDAVAVLLERHALPDPAAGQPVGRFTDPALQALHDALLARGAASLVEALRVGAGIEELDIRDLRAAAAATEHADIVAVYDTLARGSRNHLRAFHEQLVLRGVTYVPEYIPQAEYDAIVGTPLETGTP